MSKTAKISAGIIFLGVAVIAIIVATKDGGSNSGFLDQMAVDTSGEARPVTMIKYNDYQCPACKVFKGWEEVLVNESPYGDMITIEYRHFPLSSIHQFAELAARATEAARVQGNFEEMHERIFEGQETWSGGNAEAIFIGYAEEIGLDMRQFQEDLHSEEMQAIVDRQRSEGNRRLVSSTPTYFINGQKIVDNPRTYNQFKTLVEMFVYR